ncbi:MAG TPA: prepilin-type N-terminal cleavage/methylation domain-containing protein [Fimbriimonadaceae bacterium]|nr:prepilin-type N-terminal cleavage/methylation domain-containing protein [Fimbriimonadaceae bacterium]
MSTRGFTLISTLVTIALILVLVVVYTTGGFGGRSGSTRADGKGTTVPGAARMKAFDTQCKSNLGQVRQSLQLAATLDEPYPATLQETRLGDGFYHCPIGKEPYQYDPSTGRVACPHPGHEKY